MNAANTNNLWGAIEAGGTKFICVVANDAGDILMRRIVPTEQPEKTLSACADFFLEAKAQLGSISALGIGSFGPIELNREARDYGCIKKTPKPGWSGTDLVGFFSQKLNVPVAFDTDVNAAALGEHTQGVAKGCRDFVYVTVGTGIGAGVMSGGNLVQGVTHLEVGHILIPRHAQDANAVSNCPFHDNCLEGLASGASLNLRAPGAVSELPLDDAIWVSEIYYLALMCANLTQIYSPQKIVLGGGVMSKHGLLPKVREEFLRLVNGYTYESILENIEDYIVPSALDGIAGVVGAIALARSVR